MTVALWALGRTKDAGVAARIRELAKRTARLGRFEYAELDGPRVSGKAEPAQVKRAEADYLLGRLGGNDRLQLLDERGKRFDSRAFAAWLDGLQLGGGSRLVFLVGGAYGFGDSLYARAEASVSLSDMTFSHQLARLMAVEQLYRAHAILRGHPYHND